MTSRIKGPGDKPPVDPTDAVGATDATGEVKPGGEAPRVGATQSARSADATDAIGRVAAQLKAGEITVDQAVEALIEDAIDRQVGRAVDAGRNIESELRELLRNYAANDPYLVGKIRRLTMAKRS
jgi:hypothetical protein